MNAEIEARFAWQTFDAGQSEGRDICQREMFVIGFMAGYKSRTENERQIPPAALANFERDKKRSDSPNVGRFEVLGFPAYHGSPQRTDCILIAYAMAVYRVLFGRYAEVRIIDQKNGKHRVL